MKVVPTAASLPASWLNCFQWQALSSTDRKKTSHSLTHTSCSGKFTPSSSRAENNFRSFLAWQSKEPSLLYPGDFCGGYMVEISMLKGEGVTTIQQQQTRVSQKLLSWCHASEHSRSALMERSLYKTTRSSLCARSQQTELGDCHGVQTTLGGNIPAQCTSKGSLGWLLSPCLMLHTESKTALSIHEGNTQHGLSKEASAICIPKSVKKWKNYKTKAEIFL